VLPFSLPAVPPLSHHTSGDVVLIEAVTRESLTDADDGLQPLIRRLAEQGRRKFVLDLRAVSYLDSTGLGAIARATITITQRDGQIRLCGLSRRVRDLMDAAKLTPVFHVFATVDDALRGF
jgi:anti-sigma B factor antagonist